MEENPQHSGKSAVIITGSSGLIGSRLIKRLSKNYRILGLDRDAPVFPPAEAECIQMDITSEQSISGAMERIRYGYGNQIASVIHLAAFYDFSGKPSPLYEEITVKGTEKFLNVLRTFEVEQLVFSSTNLIYRPTTPGQKINEDCPLGPNWDYPESKVDTEKIIHDKKGNMKAAILRIAGVYDDYCHSIPISHQIQRIYERQLTSHFFSGDVSHGNVFVHLDDLTDAVESSVDRRQSLPEIVAINIGEPKTPSYDELQKTIGKLIHGEDWETYEIPKALAKVGAWSMDLFGDPFIKPWMIDRADDHYEMDITRAKELLGWWPKHSLLTTLPEIIKNLKTDPAGWYKKNHIDPPNELKKEKALN